MDIQEATMKIYEQGRELQRIGTNIKHIFISSKTWYELEMDKDAYIKISHHSEGLWIMGYKVYRVVEDGVFEVVPNIEKLS